MVFSQEQCVNIWRNRLHGHNVGPKMGCIRNVTRWFTISVRCVCKLMNLVWYVTRMTILESFLIYPQSHELFVRTCKTKGHHFGNILTNSIWGVNKPMDITFTRAKLGGTIY